MNTSLTRLKTRHATLAIGLMWMGIDAAFGQTKLPPVHSAYGPTSAPHASTMANYDLDLDSLIRERHMERLRTDQLPARMPPPQSSADRGTYTSQGSTPNASGIHEQYAQPLHGTREPIAPPRPAANSSYRSRPPTHPSSEVTGNESADPELSGRVYSQVGRATETDIWNPEPWSHSVNSSPATPSAAPIESVSPTNGEFATRQAVLQSRPGEDQARVSPVYANVPVQDSSSPASNYVETQRQREIELRTREIEQQLRNADAAGMNSPATVGYGAPNERSIDSNSRVELDTSIGSTSNPNNIDGAPAPIHEPCPTYRDTDLAPPSGTPQQNPLRAEKTVVAEPQTARQENAIVAPPFVESVAMKGVAAKDAQAETSPLNSLSNRSQDSLVYQTPEPPEPPQLTAMISRLVLGTATVLGVCIVSLMFVKKWMPVNVIPDRPAPTMRVVGSLALPNKSFLQLVEVDERRMVVGGNPGGVQAIVPLAESFRDQWSPDDEDAMEPETPPSSELREYRKSRREEEPRVTATTRNAVPELIVVKSTEHCARTSASSRQEDVVSAKVPPAATHQFLRAMLSDI